MEVKKDEQAMEDEAPPMEEEVVEAEDAEPRLGEGARRE